MVCYYLVWRILCGLCCVYNFCIRKIVNMPRASFGQSQDSTVHSNDLTQSLSTSDSSQEIENITEKVNKCIRYVIYHAGHKGVLRRPDIQKHCGARAQQFDHILAKAREILRNVYGINVLTANDSDTKGTKSYIITNALPHISYDLSEEPSNVNKILLLLILTHIFMTNAAVSEASLYNFLKNFDIEADKSHPEFGQGKEYITSLVKQKYLATESEPISKKVSYKWGIRAEKEVEKMEILVFVSKIFKKRMPKSWNNNFKVAKAQKFDNQKIYDDTMSMSDED